MKITIVAVDLRSPAWASTAVEDYLTRFPRDWKVELKTVKEEPRHGQSKSDLMAAEADRIRKAIPKGAWLCVLTPEGRLLSSEQLADTLRQAKLGGRSGACFLIGSSFGIAPEIKALADLQLSMSKMTFPHHLARVMALEQLYRAEAIQAGSKYHK